MVKKKAIQPEKIVDKYEINVWYSTVDQCFLSEAPALSGCMSHGNTPEEAITNGRDAVLSWLDAAISEGMELPDTDTREYSGKFNVRFSKSLHERLARQAKREGVSLNHLMSELVAGGLENRKIA